MLLDKGIIDVHAHILPGVDDGCRYIGETIELLKLAYEQGVRGVIESRCVFTGNEALSGAGDPVFRRCYGKTGFRRNINSGRDKICTG